MLTKRQAEVLQKLLKLYGESPAGVHYTVLARELGMSRWSAYEMLRGLEKRGLTQRRYDATSRRGRGGRPRVLFAPTPEGTAALVEALNREGAETEWSTVAETLLHQIGHMTSEEVHERLSGLREPSPLSRCAHLVTSLLVMARDSARDSRTAEALERIVRSPVPFLTKLSAFSGALSSTHLEVRERASQEMERVRELLQALELHAPRLRTAERTALIEFLSEALRRIQGTDVREPT